MKQQHEVTRTIELLDECAIWVTARLFFAVYLVTLFLWCYEPVTMYLYHNPSNNNNTFTPVQYNATEGAWVDFVADTGDGWDSTFAIATTLAQPTLTVDNFTLPRGTALIVGGDIVYPYPTTRGLHERFVAPFTTALQPLQTYTWFYSWLTIPISLQMELHLKRFIDNTDNETNWANKIEPLMLPDIKHEMANWCHPQQIITAALEKVYMIIGNHPGFRPFKRWTDEDYRNRTMPAQLLEFPIQDWLPEMYLIPGNHDSLDGFAAFAHLLEKPFVGGWKLKQTRQYFIVEKEAWIILGVHDQHAAGCDPDIDMEQLLYFMNNLNGKTAKTIVVMHSPFWVLERNPGEYLSRLFEYLGDTLVAIVAGDMHYYSHHIPEKIGPHLIISGGGGAFLHSTYSIPSQLNVTLHPSAVGYEYKLTQTFPDPLVSLCRLRYIRFNGWFCFGAVICSLMILAVTRLFVYYLHFCYPLGFILPLTYIYGLERWYCIVVVSAVLLSYGAIKTAVDALLDPYFKSSKSRSIIMYCFLAGLITVTVFAPILHLFGILDQGLFGPLGDADYKNFIRFHFNQDQLEAFVIGLKQAFPKDLELQTAFDVDVTGERPDALGQRYATVVDKDWFQNNMLLVERFTMDISVDEFPPNFTLGWGNQ